MDTIANVMQMEIWHAAYNTEGRHNIDDLPEEKAVFALFGIVNGQPVNCRFVGATEDLRSSIKDLFEAPFSAGLKNFMQGAWVPLLLYVPLPHASPVERDKIREMWVGSYAPAVDDNGEYPGYYNY